MTSNNWQRWNLLIVYYNSKYDRAQKICYLNTGGSSEISLSRGRTHRETRVRTLPRCYVSLSRSRARDEDSSNVLLTSLPAFLFLPVQTRDDEYLFCLKNQLNKKMHCMHSIYYFVRMYTVFPRFNGIGQESEERARIISQDASKHFHGFFSTKFWPIWIKFNSLLGKCQSIQKIAILTKICFSCQRNAAIFIRTPGTRDDAIFNVCKEHELLTKIT